MTVATIVVTGGWERWNWRLGLAVPPPVAVRDLAGGLLFGALVVGTANAAVLATSPIEHGRGGGFPWAELLAVYLPAVLHEEMLFRGYPLQKLLGWNRRAALLLMAVVFGALHLNNDSITPLGLANITIGGLLLGLAFELFGRLWFPIGLHLGWNVVSGPLLGHEVSGYTPARSVLTESGHGPAWLTGGDFGIEGSLWLTVSQCVAIAVILGIRRYGRRRGDAGE